MIYNEITKAQNITNKAHAKQDFTTYLTKSKSRYIVSKYNIFVGKNFAKCHDILTRVTKVIDSGFYDSVGGWNYEGTYWLDANLHFDNLELAIQSAKNSGEIAIYDTVNKVTIYTENLKK